jgi:hypothetical protein
MAKTPAMATILILAAAQLLVFGAGFALLWRRFDRLDTELVRLRRVVESMELDRAAPKRSRAKAEPALARAGASARASDPASPEDELWPPRPVERARGAEPPLIVVDEAEEPAPWRAAFTPDRLFIAATIALSALPLLGLPFAIALGEISSAGLLIAAVLTLASLREGWAAAAWSGLAGGIAWALSGLSFGAAVDAPILFSVSAGIAGAAGLAQLYARANAPGVLLTLAMSASLLALGAITSVIGPAGAALAALVLIAASMGASSLRLEPLHHAAFAAAGAALFVLSAQDSAAIWFTPSAALAAALFLAIAFVRVPMLGPRGGALAGTGAGASMFAVGALYVSQHGLANPLAAAGAFLALALAFAGLIALAAKRRQGGVDALKLTLWVLGFCSFAAAASAVFIAAPAPLHAPLMAMLGAGLVVLDSRVKSLAWRALAVGALTFTGLAAWSAASAFVLTTPDWPRWTLLLATFAIPAALTGAGAYLARRSGARLTADLFEAFAVIAALTTAALTLRYAFSAGAVDRLPMGFIEAGAHIGLWLCAVWALAANHQRGLAGALLVLALILGAVSGLLWLTPFWLERPLSALEVAPFQHAPLGFAFMAAPAWALWIYWRARGAHTRTRAAFGAAALATAAFLTHEFIAADTGSDWAGIGVGVTLFALAIGASASRGVVSGQKPPRYLRRRLA